MNKILTPVQMEWVKGQLKGFDVIYAGIHGSFLYGLDREGSDVDVKAIYMPTTKDILLNHCKTYNRKNDQLNVEIEIKSYPEFVRSCAKVDTNCFDLLHSPENMSIVTTPFWEHIKLGRGNLYVQRMKGLVGYIKTHVHKYSHKIERYEDMAKLLDICIDLSSEPEQEDLKVSDIAEFIGGYGYNFKYVKVFEQVQDHEQKYLEVCGKKYIFTWNIEQLIVALEKEISRYGKRTQDGVDKGLDTKSLSHALRVLVQLEEVLDTSDLVLPLCKEKRDLVMSVKLGEKNLDETLELLDTTFDRVMSKLESRSDFPEEPSVDFLVEGYRDYVDQSDD